MIDADAPATLLPDEGDALNAARLLAKTIADRLNSESYSTDDPSRARVLGRLTEVAEALGDACFSLLNTASSYAHDPVAAAAVEAWMRRDKSPEESAR